MQIIKDDVLVLKPSAIAVLGVPVEITKQDSDSDTNGIKLRYTILKSEKNSEGRQVDTVDMQVFDKDKGNWILRASPSIVLYDGEEARVERTYVDGTGPYQNLKIILTTTVMDDLQVSEMFGGQLPSLSKCPENENGLSVLSDEQENKASASHLELNKNSLPAINKDKCVNCRCNDNSVIRCCGTTQCCDEVCGGCCR